MKTVFFKLQLSKGEMNKLRGGAQRCHCGGNSNVFLVNGADTYDELDSIVGKICGDAGWGCSRA